MKHNVKTTKVANYIKKAPHELNPQFGERGYIYTGQL